MRVGGLLLFFCVVGLVYSTCLNDCSQNGSCGGDDTCECDTNWTGSDCSVYDQYLNAGDTALQSVKAKQWKFFRHSVRIHGKDLVWWLNETTEIGDCDLYLQLGAYPGRTSFTQRNVSALQNTQLIELDADVGIHYAGVYGFSQCEFEISVNEAVCTEGCEHGVCVAGVCECEEGFIGDTCETKYLPLNFGETLQGSLEKSANFDYYYTDLRQGDHVVFTLEDDNVGGDCDMYMARDRLPTRYDWDRANATLKDTTTIEIPSAVAGRYIVGLHGFSECYYQISVSRVTGDEGCVSKCSKHGMCTEDIDCDCNNGYRGDFCEWREAPLVLSTPETGYAMVGGWNYYNIRVITQNALVIRMSQVGDAGDCDLFVRQNDKPSQFVFDYYDLNIESETEMVIQQPGEDVWYIGVYGWDDCSYTLTVTEEIVCNCGLNNYYGTCAEDGETCLCDDGWSGLDCRTRLKELENGVALLAEGVGQYRWNYYKFEVTESSTGVVSVRENFSTGMLWMYISFTEEPTLWSYDLVSEVSTPYHEISVTVPNPQTRTLYVGIYGNPFGIHDEGIQYDLVAWASPF